MARKMALLVLLILACFAWGHSADPFYTNLLNEGKQQYLAGKLDEALESFQLAEFGLLDEKEYVAELYHFYAITQYKKGAIAEARALLDKMKAVLGEEGAKKARKPREIERDLFNMTRALNYLDQPGAQPGMLPFMNLFYETWDLLRAKEIAQAEARLKIMDRMKGDERRLSFLEGYLYFLKGDHKRCIGRLKKVVDDLAGDLGEDAQFYLAYCHLKRGDLVAGEKYAGKIKNPDYVHQLMDLMEEIKATSSKEN